MSVFTANQNPVLVTGATGFIGDYLVARLLQKGWAVRVLALPGETVRNPWQEAVEIARGDVRDRESVARAMQGIQTVFHLAAVVGDEAPAALFDAVTVQGTRNVLGAAATAGAKVVLASSITVYGERIQDSVLTEDLPFGQPAGLYGRSKQAQERLARELERENNLQVVIVRPGNVYGLGSRLWLEGVVAELRRGTPSLIGGGDFDAGLCHVRNLVEIFIQASATPGAVGQAFNAADGEGITWKTYFGDLARLAGAPQPRAIRRGLAGPLSRAVETTWRGLRLPGRPPLTYEAFNLVGFPTQFPLDKTRAVLGYSPVINYSQALAEIAESLTRSR